MRKRVLLFSACLFVLLFFACEPLVTTFDNVEDAKMYSAETKQEAPSSVEEITVMTWNIRFGAGRLPWFGDSNGDRVILTKDEVLYYLNGIADYLAEVKPDILFIQEIDIQSKRSAYIDQVKWLLDHTDLNYGAYASVWKAQVIPSDGLGRMDMGTAILSRWPITDAERIKLPLRGDQDALTKHFYLRRNIIKAKIDIPGMDEFYALNIHTSAFSTDDTKPRQVEIFKSELDDLASRGIPFVAGGDLNTLPPGAAIVDYCMVDKADDEHFHGPNDDPYHKEGSYYGNETTMLQPFYDDFYTAIPLEDYLQNESAYFSHTTDWTAPYDRKLDYLFSKTLWIEGSGTVHQDAAPWSDHAPVSAKWGVPQ